MAADINREISMEKITLDTKMDNPRYRTPNQNNHTHIFMDDSMDIPEVLEPENSNEKNDPYMLLMLALRTSFVYKKRDKNCVKDEEDAAAGPSNLNKTADSVNDSLVQVNDVSSSDTFFVKRRHLVEKNNSPTEKQGITFSVEKYFLNNIKQDTPPPNHYDNDTDMEIDVMNIEKDKNEIPNVDTENIANNLQSYNYYALTQTCCLCQKSRCSIRDKYHGEKLTYQSIPEPPQIIPALREEVKNLSQTQNTQGNQYWMKYVESAPLTVSKCSEESFKDHQTNHSFGSMYPEMRGLIAPVPVRPIRPYNYLDYMTSRTSTSDQQRINHLQYPEQSIKTGSGPVLSAPLNCDYWNLPLGVNHTEVPEAPLNLTTYSQDHLQASINLESFSQLQSSAFVPYEISEFLYSSTLLNNHCQQSQYHSSVLTPGVHSPLADSVSSTVHDQRLSVPDTLLPVKEERADFCQEAPIARCGYWCPPPSYYIP